MAASLHFGVNLREHWRDLKRGRPGRRFQDRYERARRQEQRCGAGQRIALLAAGFVCLMIAVVLSVIPGPAIPFYFIAGGLFATESRVIARVMDWSEVRARTLLAWGKWQWRRLPFAGRVVAVVVAVCVSAAAAYLSYRVFIG